MTKNERKRFGRWLGCLATAAVLAACSAEKPASTTAATPAKSPGAAPVQSTNTASTARVVRSKFTVDPNLRDPFFPGSKKASQQVAGTGAPESGPMDIPGLLQAGFLGVIGAGESRIGMINNVILEPGRTVVIPLQAGGVTREVTVRVREVLPNAVILEIKGERQPITIRRPQR